MLNNEVQNLHADLFLSIFKPYQAQEINVFFERFVTQKGFISFVAFDGEEPVGYIFALLYKMPENAFKYANKVRYIDQIGVNKSHQKRGIATLLINEVKAIGINEKVSRIELDHWNDNTNAEAFFARLGFSPFYEKMCLKL